jgi:hypothetical protein
LGLGLGGRSLLARRGRVALKKLSFPPFFSGGAVAVRRGAWCTEEALGGFSGRFSSSSFKMRFPWFLGVFLPSYMLGFSWPPPALLGA